MVEAAISGSALIVLLLAVRAVFKKHLTSRFRCALWALALLRLLLPIPLMPSPFSLMNALPQPAAAPAQAPSYVYVSPSALPAPAEGSAEAAASSAPAPGGAPPAFESAPAVSEAPAEGGAAAAVGPDTHGAPAWGVREALKAAWAAGSVCVGGWFLFINLSCARSLRRRREFLFRHEGLDVYAAEGLRSPCIFGLPRPAVYLPPAVAGDGEARRHVLAHETAHYRRGDHIWALLRGLCLALYWWDPIVWLGAAAARSDCELACDERAIARLGEGERYRYGLTLVGLVSPARRAGDLLSAATTMTGSKRNIRERVDMIVKKPKNAAVSLAAVLLLVAFTTACAFTGAQTETDGFTPGVYVMENGAGVPVLTLRDDGSFSLDLGREGQSRADGLYNVDGAAVTLAAYGGGSYLLEQREGNLAFVAEGSDELRYYPQARSSRTLADGDAFVLSASLEGTAETAGIWYADLSEGDTARAWLCPVLTLGSDGRFSLTRGSQLEAIEGSYSADGGVTLTSDSGESFVFTMDGESLLFDPESSDRDLFLSGALAFRQADGGGEGSVSAGGAELPQAVWDDLAARHGWMPSSSQRMYSFGGLSVYSDGYSLSDIYASYTGAEGVEISLSGGYNIYRISGSAIDEDNAAITVFRTTDHDVLADVFFTGDGGLTWQASTAQPPSTYVGSGSLYGDHSSQFISPDVGYVSVAGPGSYFPALYLTFNGGASWISCENIPHAILIEDADYMSFTGIEGLTEAGYLRLYATSARGYELWESVYTFNTEGRCCAMSDPVPVRVELMDGEEHTAYLDGPGVRDTVSYSAADGVGQLVINGTDYSAALAGLGADMLPYAKVVDMDTADGLLEIALGYRDAGGSARTALAQYKDGALALVGGSLPGVEPLWNEDGGADELTFYGRGGGAAGRLPLGLLNSDWRYLQDYAMVYENGAPAVVPVEQELFIIPGGEGAAGPVTTLEPLRAYAQPDTGSEQSILPAGTDLIFYSTDNKSWASVIAPDGEMYWLRFSDFRHIEDASGNNLYIRDAFSGLEN